MNPRLKKGIIAGIIILVFLFGIWGYYGGQKTKEIGFTCDIGILENNLCWKWHKNIFGEIQDTGEKIKEEVNQIFEE